MIIPIVLNVFSSPECQFTFTSNFQFESQNMSYLVVLRHNLAKTQFLLRIIQITTKSINNKVLMCSTGNYTQYPVINHNGKEYKKRMYICV